MLKVMLLILAILLTGVNLSAQQLLVPVAGVVTIDTSPARAPYEVLVNATVTSVVFTNQVPGQLITVLFLQDSTGHGVTFGGNILSPCTVSSTASALTSCQFQYDARTVQWTGLSGGGGAGTFTTITASGLITANAGITSGGPNIFGNLDGVEFVDGSRNTTIAQAFSRLVGGGEVYVPATITSSAGFTIGTSQSLRCAGQIILLTGSVTIPQNSGNAAAGSKIYNCQLKANANNVTVISAIGTAGNQIAGLIFHDVITDGNSSSFTGTQGFLGAYVNGGRFYDFSNYNSSSNGFKCTACFETKWFGGSNSSNTTNGVYLTDDLTNGSSEFSFFGVKANNNTGDGFFFEGSSGQIDVYGGQSDTNAGACVRTASTTLGGANGLYFAGVCENNKHATAQIIITGTVGQPAVSTRIAALIHGGGVGAAPTAISVDQAQDTWIQAQSFGHTNFLNVTANASKVSVDIGNRTTDTNYITGAGSATIVQNTGGGWQIGPSLSAPLTKSNASGNFTSTSIGSTSANSAAGGAFRLASGDTLNWRNNGNTADISLSKGTTDGLNVPGTTSNDNAPAGTHGEYVSSTIAIGASIALTTGTTANVTSVSLTAGDWDCSGAVDFTFGATTSYTNLVGGFSTTSATLGPQDSKFDFETPAAVPTAAADATWVLPVFRESLASTTTVFLVAQATFSVSTLKAYGTLRCRRTR